VPEPLRGLVPQLAAGELPWPLTVWGSAGTGKTCFGLTLVDYCGGFFWSTDDFCEVMADAKMGRLTTPGAQREISATELWQELACTSLVVLDELGTTKEISDHHYRSVKRLLDLRENLPMVVMMNVPLYQIAVSYGEPVASRLAGGTVCKLEGQDRRLSDDARSSQPEARENQAHPRPGTPGAFSNQAGTGPVVPG